MTHAVGSFMWFALAGGLGASVAASEGKPACGERRVFLDLGANDGQSLRRVVRASATPYTDVVLFEMNEHFHPTLRALLDALPASTRTSLQHAAAWVSDGAMDARMQLPGSRTGVHKNVTYNMTVRAATPARRAQELLCST